MAGNKSSLSNVLQAVLSVANAEQNSTYPPLTYQNHYNIVTSFLLDKLSALYPAHQDILLGFMEQKKISVTDGYIQLPDTYRNLLGSPSILVKKDGSDCSDSNAVVIDTESEFKTAIKKSGCKTVPIEIVDKSEWDYRTTSLYAFPTLKNPIGLYIAEKRIKVCPYDLAKVDVLYVKNEDIYTVAYITQPDDTFLIDESNTSEVQWDSNAFEYLFKGIFALYSAYSRDQSLTNYSQILNQAGLF